MFNWKRCFYSIFFILWIIGLVACQETDLQQNDEKPVDPETATSIQELTDTKHFREGAIKHIMEGERNASGDVVGYHYEGLSSNKAQIVQSTKKMLNEHGVYEAEVVLEGDKKKGNKGKSTFFPIDWTPQEVIDAINQVYEGRIHITGNMYEGLTEEGIVVRMYLDDKEKIISAFPVH